MRKYIEAIVGITFVIFIYYILYPIAIILDNIRRSIFGPQLSRSLRKYAEKEWAERHPGWPKEYMSYGLTLGCDEVDWWYKDGRWQIQPKRIGGTRHSLTWLPDGTRLEREEWTNEKGEREHREWKIPPELKEYDEDI